MRCYLRDPTFSRFDTIPECDRHTHTHTDRQTDRDRHTTTAYTALSKASRGKNKLETLAIALSAILPSGLNNAKSKSMQVYRLQSQRRQFMTSLRRKLRT